MAESKSQKLESLKATKGQVVGNPVLKAEEREAIKKAMAEQQVQPEVLAPGTPAEAEKAANGQAKLRKQVEREVADKEFPVIRSEMFGIESFTLAMTFRELADYIGFAVEIYDKDADLLDKWQRDLVTNRIDKIKDYLLGKNGDTRYFPSILVVPNTEKVQVVDNKVTIKAARMVESIRTDKMVHDLSALDGQHRLAAILRLLADYPEYGDESITVVILNTADKDVKQLIFSVINSKTVKVPRPVSIMFDHQSRAATLAKLVVQSDYMKVVGQKNLVAFEKTMPLQGDNQIMSITNLFELINPIAELKVQTESENGETVTEYLFSDESIVDTVKELITNLPMVKETKEGKKSFKDLKADYIYPFGTCWKALGSVLEKMAMTTNDSNVPLFPVATFPEAVKAYVQHVNSASGWNFTNPKFKDGKDPVVSPTGKIQTQRGAVKRLIDVLESYVQKPSAPVVAGGSQTEVKAEGTGAEVTQ